MMGNELMLVGQLVSDKRVNIGESWFSGQYCIYCPKCERVELNHAGCIGFKELMAITGPCPKCGSPLKSKIITWMDIHIIDMDGAERILDIADVRFVGEQMWPVDLYNEYYNKDGTPKDKRITWEGSK